MSPEVRAQRGVDPTTNGHGELEALRCSDRGNAARFAQDHRGELLWVPGRGWLAWDGRRLATDADELDAMRRAKLTATGLFAEAAYAEDEGTRRELARHALRSESEPSLRRMLTLARSERGMAASPQDLDRDDLALNTPSGLLDLRTRTLRTPARRDLVTRITAAPYVEDARHPVLEAFLKRVLPDPDLRAFVQRFAGYCLTGLTTEEKLPILVGPTAGGKTTLTTMLRRAMGEYAAVADFASFLEGRHEGPRDDLARLDGVRLVIAAEAKEGDRLAAGVVKMLTGGDTVAARRLYGHIFEFVPRFKLVLASNFRPRARDDDGGLWRRLMVVPFVVSLSEQERDPRVKSVLCDPAEGGPAVLAWAVEGCRQWIEHGLDVPRAVRAASEDYRRSQDPLTPFLADCCVFEDVASVSARELREAYERWTKEQGIRYPLTGGAFADRLRGKGCEQRRRHGGERWWEGLRLRGPLDGDAGDAGDATSNTSLSARAGGEVTEMASPASPLSPEPDWVRE